MPANHDPCYEPPKLTDLREAVMKVIDTTQFDADEVSKFHDFYQQIKFYMCTSGLVTTFIFLRLKKQSVRDERTSATSEIFRELRFLRPLTLHSKKGNEKQWNFSQRTTAGRLSRTWRSYLKKSERLDLPELMSRAE